MKSKIVYFLYRRRTMFLALLAAFCIVAARPTKLTFFIGLPFCILGEVIRIWSAGHLQKNDALTTTGPFALCRNPLYLGTFISSIGCFIICDKTAIWIAGILIVSCFHAGAVIYEEKMLTKLFGEDFINYKKRVHCLLPNISKITHDTSFSWKQVWHNKEYRGLIQTLAIATLFAIAIFISDKPSTIHEYENLCFSFLK